MRPEAAGIKTILLAREDGMPLRYAAGQFLTLLFSWHGREVRRSYSFSSAPAADAMAAISVKRVPNGEVSRYLLDQLRVGDRLESLDPAGRFTLDAIGSGNSLFFIAAGSGLVPIFSLLKQALATMPSVRVILISQQHDEASAPFGAALQALETKHGPARFQWINLLTVRDGRLTNGWLEEWVLTLLTPAQRSRTWFYLCGPVVFMRMAQFTLRLLGMAEERIKKEHFTTEHVPPPPQMVDAAPKRIILHTTGGGIVEFPAAWPDSILTAGLKQGLHLPYSCRAGRCSTCVARLLRGKVRMSVNEVLTEKELQEGLVLTCVGYAETEAEILI